METMFKQKSKVGGAGSFFNQIMSNNSTIPVVGQGATEMHYSDRGVYEVISVSKCGKEVQLEQLNAIAALPNSPIGHQNWKFEPTGQFLTVVWRNNAWKRKFRAVHFTKAFAEAHKGCVSYARKLTEQQRIAVYGGEVHPQNAVEGITEEVTRYSKMNLLFGVKDYHYDWSF